MNNKIHRILLAGAAVALLSTQGQAATVVLQKHASNVSVGDSFLVDVVLQQSFSGTFAGDQLLAFGLDLSYDQTALELTSRSVGPLWDDDTPLLNVGLAGSVFPSIADDGSNSPILLGELSFKALSMGTFSLVVTGNNTNNPNLGLVYLSGSDNILAGTQVNVVPIPAAAWLLGSGLIALARVRRRY